MLKTKEEIEVLREGGKRLAYIVRTVSEMVAPGVTTLELEEKARELFKKSGGKPAFLNYSPGGATRPYPAAICTSVNEAIVHGIPNENPITLKEGDIITVDGGLEYEGLITDHAITVPVGKIDGKLTNLLEQNKRALKVAIEKAQAGNYTGDIAAAVQAIGDAHDFGIPLELGGHGVGHKVHEDPFVPNVGRAKTGDRIKVGMVLALEPMFSLGADDIVMGDDDYTILMADGAYSSLFEHTIAVTEEGTEILTIE